MNLSELYKIFDELQNKYREHAKDLGMDFADPFIFANLVPSAPIAVEVLLEDNPTQFCICINATNEFKKGNHTKPQHSKLLVAFKVDRPLHLGENIDDYINENQDDGTVLEIDP